jgi:PqqD family protein of HPr-rel-A system
MAGVGTGGPANGVDRGSCRSQRWQAAGGGPLRWRCWAGEYVVFNPLSGQTHHLDVLAGRMLELIVSATPSADELRVEASSFLEVEQDDQLIRLVDELLRRLEGAGLIEPVR